MSIFGRFLSRIFKPRETVKVVPSRRSKYDAAQDTVENEKHWSNADDLSANAANSPAVRSKLRKRSRYECSNNTNYSGLNRGLAQDLVGTGPRLQLRIPGIDRKILGRIQRSFALWVRKSGFADTLRILHETRIRDGEAFAILSTNPKIDHEVKLNVRLYEADQVTTPDLNPSDKRAVDGMRLDEFGNATEYHFLKNHPGDLVWGSAWDYDRIPASAVIHWFRPDRPGQHRGIPELTPGLPLLAQLRRYCAATLGAAELAAKIAGILKTNSSAVDAAPVKIEAMDEIELPTQALLTAPYGWDVFQFKPEQPINSFADFKAENLTDFGRPVQAPRNVVTGNSAPYNYSSGRLDRLIYQAAQRVERNRCALFVLDRIFLAWLDEALFVPDLIPAGLPPFAQWAWDWGWDGFESIDPVKDATATQIDLATGMANYADALAERGKDWEEHFEQRAAEKKRAAELGLTTSDLSVTFTDENGAKTEVSSKSNASTKPANGDQSAEQAAEAGNVQATALNGAQIASLLLVTDKLATKQYPADASEAIIQAAFPLMDRGLINKFITSLDKHEPAEPEESEASDLDDDTDPTADDPSDEDLTPQEHAQFWGELVHA